MQIELKRFDCCVLVCQHQKFVYIPY